MLVQCPLLFLELLGELSMLLSELFRFLENFMDWILISCRIAIATIFHSCNVIHFIVDHHRKSVRISVHRHIFHVIWTPFIRIVHHLS